MPPIQLLLRIFGQKASDTHRHRNSGKTCLIDQRWLLFATKARQTTRPGLNDILVPVSFAHFSPLDSRNNFVHWETNLCTEIYMSFTGREVRMGKNCARGLEYGPRPQAEGRPQDQGT